MLENTFLIVLLNRISNQDETWQKISITYNEHLQIFSSLILKTGA